MATALRFNDNASTRTVSTPHGDTPQGLGLSLSEIENFDYLTGRPGSQSSLIRFEYLNPPKVVLPTASPTREMELGYNPQKAESSLHKAARDGDEEAIANIIKGLQERSRDKEAVKYKLNKKDRSDYTALHYAVRYGHESVVHLLLENGADINLAGDNGTQPIHLAARHTKPPRRTRITSHARSAFVNGSESYDTIDMREQSQPILKILLNSGADCNAKDGYMQTPLHYAALKGNLLAVEILSNAKGIQIEAEDKSKATPLHCACSSGSIDVVRRLILCRASMLKRDDEKLTPFHYIVIAGNLELLKEVIGIVERTDGYVDITSLLTDRDDHNQTALHHAVMNGNLQIAKLLLENKSEVNAKRYGMSAPLHLAAANGNIDIVRLLLSYEADIEGRNAQGETALHVAAIMNRENVVSFLLSRGAKLNSLADDGSTPLILAAAMNNSRIVHCLVINYGARDDYGDASERTAMYWAAHENAMDSLQILLNCENYRTTINLGDRYDNTPLHVAAMKGYTGIVSMLAEYGAKLDPVNDEDLTPLHLSAKNGHVKVVRQLLERKPTMVSDEDESANTALHHASVAGHADVIQTLIEFGASIDVRNAALWTPLDSAAAHGHVNAARVLLDRDSPVDPTDRAKTTPLHLACKGGFVEMTKLLIEHGADITLCDIEGKNCLDLAVENGFKDAALTILEHRDWLKAMQHRTKEAGKITTPMRRMIEKLPGVALAVFNKCIELSKKDGNDVITLYYEFLDDTYSKWNTETKEDYNADTGLVTDPYYYYMLLKDGKDNKYELELDKKRNHPLAIMVEHEQEKLLSHPLVQSLIYAKWRKFGRAIYYSKLALFVLFLFFLTGYTVESTPFNPVYQNKTGTEECVSSPLPDDVKVNFFVKAGKYFIIVLAGIQLIFELIQFINRRLSYFRSSENYVELLLFVLSIVYVSDFTYGERLDINRCGATHISIGSLAIFLAWINLLLFLRKFPNFGIYFVMFLDVFKTFSLFSVTFSLFIVAFGLGFYVLLNKQMKPFESPQRSMMKSVVMMIGEFEFDSIFNDQSPYDVTWILFAVFVVVCTIILMNLLVGLAVDDIKTVQEKAALKRISMQVDLVLEVEKFIPFRLRKRSKLFTIKTKETINASKQNKLLNRIKPHPASMSAIENAKRYFKEPIDVVEENTRILSESVTDLKSEMKSMKERFDGIEAMLKSLVEHQAGKATFKKT